MRDKDLLHRGMGCSDRGERFGVTVEDQVNLLANLVGRQWTPSHRQTVLPLHYHGITVCNGEPGPLYRW